jgi:hypothetical protein
VTGVLATLRRIGQHETVELIPGEPASRTHVQVAEREGLLMRDEAGALVDRPPPWAGPMPEPLPLRQPPTSPQEDAERVAGAFAAWGRR